MKIERDGRRAGAGVVFAIVVGLAGCLPEGWPPPAPREARRAGPPLQPMQIAGTAKPGPPAAIQPIQPGVPLGPAQTLQTYSLGATFRVTDVRLARLGEGGNRPAGVLALWIELNRPAQDDSLLLKNLAASLAGLGPAGNQSVAIPMVAVQRGPGRAIYICTSGRLPPKMPPSQEKNIQCDVAIRSGARTAFPLVDQAGQLLDGNADGQPGGDYHKAFFTWTGP